MKMRRQHLYKAKRTNWRELPKEEWWVEGDLIHEPYGTVIQYYEEEIKDKGNCAKTSKIKRVKVVVDPETVCEYTGLTDKNDRKIFEWDIVNCIEKRGAAFRLCKIVWNRENARFDVANMDCSFPMCTDGYGINILISGLDYEVIGNIFDNPELLKGDELNE